MCLAHFRNEVHLICPASRLSLVLIITEQTEKKQDHLLNLQNNLICQCHLMMILIHPL